MRLRPRDFRAGRRRSHNKQRKYPNPGEIWIAKNLKFDGNTGSKTRPVVVISSEGNKVEYCQCTTKPSLIRERHEILDMKHTGLSEPSFVDMERHHTHSHKLSYKVGRLSEYDAREIGL